MKPFLICCAILFSSLVYASAQTLKGTVKSSAGGALASARVVLLNSAKGALTDKDGNFTIENAPRGQQTISISFVGYATQVRTIAVDSDETTVIITLQERGATLDEIVVSAEKYETTLQRSPVAITALSAKQFQDYRVWGIADLAALAPNLFVGEHAGSQAANFLNIRGTLNYTSDESVATYVDGVYQFGFYAAAIQMLDVERIEVLRGPQGTLYGRNAMGGVVSIHTRKPTNQTTGYAEATLGNYGQQRYSASIAAPLVQDKLFASIGALYNRRGGFFTNDNIKQTFDGQEGITANLNMRYLATDNLSFALNVKNEYNNDAGAYPWVASDSLLTARPYVVYGNYPNTERRNNFNASLTGTYYADGFTLTSVTSYQDFQLSYPDRFDIDFTALDVISGASTNPQQN
jgi:iron complex outermembrane recepter protein